MIVFDDADFELAVDAAIISAFRTTGQRCVSAERLLVQEGIFETFVDRAKRIRIGDPLDESTFMGPMVSQAEVEKFEYYNDLAIEEATVLKVKRNERRPSESGRARVSDA